MGAAVLTRERAPAVVRAAVAEHDAIQANLLELRQLRQAAAGRGGAQRRDEAALGSHRCRPG